ncbi:transmembrane protein 138 isoform X2 [Haemorhous mexicanus]|uniref:transmembrane protein 138 isoform X2 n=1 Tax=Haemorhous mexicanus TaxID=30427 RepID=UPI0028BE5E6B|nr:transmembrane protein 138 isoform X2 [Haemorhous mexicanus]
MLQPSNYSLVLFLQFLLLSYDLFVNSFSELLRTAPAVQLVLFIIQDIAIVFNIIIVFLMFFNTYVFQAGLVNLLFHKFKGTILLSAAYLALSISFHVWIMNLRWRDSSRFIWTEGLQTLFVFQRLDRHRSSAPLQVLLFLNGWYCATYFLLEAFVFVYKVLLLPYPVFNLVLDVVLLLLYLGIEVTRIFFARIPTEDTAQGHRGTSPVPAPFPSPRKGEDPSFPTAHFTLRHLDTSIPPLSLLCGHTPLIFLASPFTRELLP